MSFWTYVMPSVMTPMTLRNPSTMERKRLLLPGFISPQLCQELVFIHKSCGVVGYRPHVFSTTLSHLVATNSAALIMPFITLRERVKEAVEEFFDCEFELFVEFTGLISWTTGANIGWHSDDNRDYLRQRHFSAVCYFNTYEHDFHGGLFHFQDGQPATVIPTLGTVLIYSANEKNIHSVDEVLDGERITMALWFTRDSAHDEDKKLIDQLMNIMPLPRMEEDKPSVSQVMDLREENTGIAPQPSQEKEGSEENADRDFMTTKIQSQSGPSDAILRDYFVPVPASTNMYWVSESETEFTAGRNAGCEAAYEAISLDFNQGCDVRVKRLASLSFHCDIQTDDPDSMLEKPLKLKYHHQHVSYEFANILHALQVVQFYECRTHITKLVSSSMCHTNQEIVEDPMSGEIAKFESHNLPRTSITREPGRPQPQPRILNEDFKETMIKPWEEYMTTLCTYLLRMLPAWQNTGSLFIRQDKEEV